MGALHGFYKIFTPQEMKMQLTVSAARQRLGEAVTRVQDPNECIVMTRPAPPAAAGQHGEFAAHLADRGRGRSLHDQAPAEQEFPHRRRAVRSSGAGSLRQDGDAREAALQVPTLQPTRAEERRILAAGGLEAVEGGELGVEVEDGDGAVVV
jgi:hypothetical protein